MRKINKKVLAFLLATSMCLSIAPPINNAFAETYNVRQTRRESSIEQFPASYQEGLKRIKEVYPNAKFIYYNTNLDWSKDLLNEDNELMYGRSLVPSYSHPSWIDERYEGEVEPGWSQASIDVIKYYMDPRNFLNPSNVFQFVNLAFDDNQTLEATQELLKDTFMEGKTIIDDKGNSITYAQALYESGKKANVSPYLLACRLIQEQGNGNSALVNGNYAPIMGYYNFFNINAAGPTTNEILRSGSQYAKEMGWDTPYKSIVGGAKILSNSYVGAGKNCLYLHHWNVIANNGVVNYTPYMTNLLAPYNEAKNLASSYVDKNANYTFIIPVYDNMPSTPCELPGEDEHLLKDLVLNNDNIKIEEFSPYKYEYKAIIDKAQPFLPMKFKLNSKDTTIKVNNTPIQSNDKLDVEKAILLQEGFNEINISITSKEGNFRNYKINVINNDSKPHYQSNMFNLSSKENQDIVEIPPAKTIDQVLQSIDTLNCSLIITNNKGEVKDKSNLCKTGDKLIIKSNDNKVISSIELVTKGDINEDGKITNDDILLLEKHIMEQISLSPQQRLSSDLDNDGKLTIVDMALIKEKITSPKEMVETKINPSLTLPNYVFGDNEATLKINAPQGSYYADGYVVYDEGKVETKDIANSGRIHFVINNGKVTFNNNKDSFNFKSIIKSGDLDFKLEFRNVYDYFNKKSIKIEPTTKKVHVQDKELDISFKNTKENTNQKEAISALEIKNDDDKTSLGNVVINLGQYLTFENNEHTKEIRGMQPSSKKEFKIFASPNLADGTQHQKVDIAYQTSKGEESVVEVPFSFNVQNHQHKGPFTFNDHTHSRICEECGEKEEGAHEFIAKDNNTYQCAICGYEAKYNVQIEGMKDNTIYTNKASFLTPSITQNGNKIEPQSIEWYIDGEKRGDKKTLPLFEHIITSKSIDCVIKTKDNNTLVHSFNLSIIQPKEKSNKLTITKLSPTKVEIEGKKNAQYRINNSKWQKELVFDKLKEGEEYKIEQRNEKTKAISQVTIKPSHIYETKVTMPTCTKDMKIEKVCKGCGKKQEFSIGNTKTKHIFKEYKMTNVANCKEDGVYKSTCVTCDKEDTKKKQSTKYHSFTKYKYNNDATCATAGTSTSTCDFGCGATHTILTNKELGHTYEYKLKSEATPDKSRVEIGTCKKCGHKVERVVHGTRLDYISNIDIMIVKNKENTLPATLVKTPFISLVDVTWKDSKGNVVDEKTLKEVDPNETYTLASIKIKLDKDYVLYDKCKTYINKKTFLGTKPKIENGIITLENVGTFKLN